MGRKSHCTSEEKRLVLMLRNEGKSLREIAKSLGRSLFFVQNALKRKTSAETRGRKKKTKRTTDNYIVSLAKRDPFKSSRQISAEINNVISARSVRRRLTDAKLPGRIARKVPLLRQQNLKTRLNFAKNHLNWSGSENAKKWRNILWSDETKINLFGNDNGRNVRRPQGKEFHVRFTKKTVKHGGGNIMVWGCFSWYGVGPIFRITDTMTRFEYKNILENTMLPYAEENMPLRWVFQQDNDPKHTSRFVKDWFQANSITLLEWPSQSPDLNPIENLWGELKRRVGKVGIQNKDQLWEIVQKTWYEIPVETCRKLISSMPQRLQKVVQNKGGYTGY